MESEKGDTPTSEPAHNRDGDVLTKASFAVTEALKEATGVEWGVKDGKLTAQFDPELSNAINNDTDHPARDAINKLKDEGVVDWKYVSNEKGDRTIEITEVDKDALANRSNDRSGGGGVDQSNSTQGVDNISYEEVQKPDVVKQFGEEISRAAEPYASTLTNSGVSTKETGSPDAPEHETMKLMPSSISADVPAFEKATRATQDL